MKGIKYWQYDIVIMATNPLDKIMAEAAPGRGSKGRITKHQARLKVRPIR